LPETEDLLRRYRPVGPPASLRDSIIAASDARPAWPWMTAAAALLLLALGLEVGVSRSYRRLDGFASATASLDGTLEQLRSEGATEATLFLIAAERERPRDRIGTVSLPFSFESQ